jgi:hypothetical protein
MAMTDAQGRYSGSEIDVFVAIDIGDNGSPGAINEDGRCLKDAPRYIPVSEFQQFCRTRTGQFTEIPGFFYRYSSQLILLKACGLSKPILLQPETQTALDSEGTWRKCP